MGMRNDEVLGTAQAVMAVAEDKSAILSQPMQLQLPLPSVSGLTAVNEEYLVVLYRIFEPESNAIKAGMFTRSEFEIVNGKALVKTLWWGTYQAAILTRKVESPVVVESAHAI